TWFLLKLLVAKAPCAVLATELLIAAMGPVSWLAMTILAVTTPAGGPSLLPSWPQAARELLGLLIAFGAIPPMVLGPVPLVIEGVTFLLVRERIARAPGFGDVDGPRPSRALRAAYDTRGPLLVPAMLRAAPGQVRRLTIARVGKSVDVIRRDRPYATRRR